MSLARCSMHALNDGRVSRRHSMHARLGFSMHVDARVDARTTGDHRGDSMHAMNVDAQISDARSINCLRTSCIVHRVQSLSSRREVGCAPEASAELLLLASLLHLLPVVRRVRSREKEMHEAMKTAVAPPEQVAHERSQSPTRDRSAVRRRSSSRASFDIEGCARVVRTTARCPSANSSPSRASMRRRITCTSETRVMHDHAELHIGRCGNG